MLLGGMHIPKTIQNQNLGCKQCVQWIMRKQPILHYRDFLNNDDSPGFLQSLFHSILHKVDFSLFYSCSHYLSKQSYNFEIPFLRWTFQESIHQEASLKAKFQSSIISLIEREIQTSKWIKFFALTQELLFLTHLRFLIKKVEFELEHLANKICVCDDTSNYDSI